MFDLPPAGARAGGGLSRYLSGCAPPGGGALPSITTLLQGALPW
jgi:hypothetical protein